MAYTVSCYRPVVIRYKGKRKRSGEKGRNVKSAVYWFAWRDEADRLHRVSSRKLTDTKTGIRNKRIAQQFALKMEGEFARGNFGLADPHNGHRRRPIEEHLVDFEEVVHARPGTADHKKDTITRARKVIAGCGFRTIGEITKAKIEVWLGRQEYRGKSISLETENRYIWSIKYFMVFLIENQRLARDSDPLVGLKKQKKKDKHRRYVRRALTWEEFLRLLKATQESSVTRRNLSPVARVVLYLLALFTGYRRGALQQISVCDFSGLDGGGYPCVTLPAEIAKNGKETPPTPLRPEVAETIRRYIAACSLGPDDRLFPRLTDRTAEVLRADLESASIPAVDDKGRVIDLHSLRYGFNAELRRRGVELTTRQRLMHHSTPELTSNTYGAVPQAEFIKAIEAMPPVPAIELLPPPSNLGE